MGQFNIRHRRQVRPCHIPRLRATDIRRRSCSSWRNHSILIFPELTRSSASACQSDTGTRQRASSPFSQVCRRHRIRQDCWALVRFVPSKPISRHVLCLEDSAEYVCFRGYYCRSAQLGAGKGSGVEVCSEPKAQTAGVVSAHHRGRGVPF